jgi:aspartyl-tRNA(Asn)/glutamyl-tRNA(Gln) amidotransferase subunit A
MIGGRAASARGHAAFTPFFNACGVPACSVPVGKVDGLPVGIQVVAPRLEDARVLAMASVINSYYEA